MEHLVLQSLAVTISLDHDALRIQDLPNEYRRIRVYFGSRSTMSAESYLRQVNEPISPRQMARGKNGQEAYRMSYMRQSDN